ncbi:MAG: DNA-3-methyladenine glycosylase [Pyrinomonadaceae bacterium]|nr:DNA-3-methyladenine glycosylase [Sphingobacteriaceae bacterium]
MKIPALYYQQNDVVNISRHLLGKPIYTNVGAQITGGIIVETEAYRGPDDKGSHAYNDRRTPRNETMYAAGGIIYMYICYGIHDMLNIVTGTEGMSHAVLIRAIEPTKGVEIMRRRRGFNNDDKRLCKGPGALAKALGLTKMHDKTSLQGDTIWIEDTGVNVPDDSVIACPRIGLNIDEPYKSIPWRFYVKGNKYISKVANL